MDLAVLGREAGREGETLGVDLGAGLGAGLDADFDAGLGAGLLADLRAGLLADLDGALAADRDTRDGADLAGEADRDFDADFRAALLAGDDLAEDLDDLPLGGAALPNAGPKVIIAVRSTANSVFSICLVNIFLAPFPGRSSGPSKNRPHPTRPAKLNYSFFHELAASNSPSPLTAESSVSLMSSIAVITTVLILRK